MGSEAVRLCYGCATPHVVRRGTAAQLHQGVTHIRTRPPVCLEVIDGLATGSSASDKSRSLELLLTLHTLVGAAVLQRTDECSSSGRGRCARCCRRPSCAPARTWCGSAQLKWRSQQPFTLGGGAPSCIHRVPGGPFVCRSHRLACLTRGSEVCTRFTQKLRLRGGTLHSAIHLDTTQKIMFAMSR